MPPFEGGLYGRYPPRFSAGAFCMVPRCGAEFVLPEPYERLLVLGGVNGRNPPRFSAGALCIVPRCGAALIPPDP